MRSKDGAIDRPQKQFGDDADGCAEYQEANGDRDKVLDTLPRVRAKTSNGLVAKAEALIERNVREDDYRREAIGTSLASDILRYFGKTAA